MLIKIGIISDTHMPKRAKKFPQELLVGLKGVDLIIHAGDWQTIDVYHELSRYAPVEGVYGNVDDDRIKDKFEKKKIFEFGFVRVGVVHGHGQGKTTEKRVIDTFSDDTVDIIIFGHSHIPIKKFVNRTWIFNPGSPTDKRRQPQYSYGFLEINETEFTLKHYYYNTKD